ncbi:hypothetical protein [Pseudomonas sp. AN-1]|uniref:hypothetical protein n=1 Tax=Pseudomonas sp. AN-1 TaxID=3096605 RepID=UPI002A6B3528|nr:hypothetical protein [Pseudomonas sp. AN-1]WPP47264.1 hypothetical protein SK095_07780 [Pseudomonas sp. AN-1]
MKKATRPEEQSRPRKADSSTAAPTKIARILAHLLAGASINRFEAEDLGDHCLPSTIAVLANRHGLIFQRQRERVPNRWGKPCTVNRYSLPASECDKARKVLAYLKRPTRPTTEG